MTTEETRPSTEDLSVAMTTTPDDDVTETTAVTSSAASSTSRGVEFYFGCAIVAISVVGTITNGLILYALVASKQHKKKILIFNQNALDFFSSLWLVVTYSLKLCNLHLSGQSGHWLCLLILTESFIWIGLIGSKVNLAAVTTERYLIVVHTTKSKKCLRNWVIYSVAAFSWIIGFVHEVAFVWPSTAVVDGICYPAVFPDNRTALTVYAIWYFLSFYGIILVIIIYCYGRILVVIHRQVRVMAAHAASGGSQPSQNQSNQKVQTNVIKTMFIVSAFFGVFNLPVEVIFLTMNFSDQVSYDSFGYYSTVFTMFLFVCINPFIYATKFDPVKRVLRDVMPCVKKPDQEAGTARQGGTGRAAAPPAKNLAPS